MAIKNKVKYYRNKYNITQEELANEIHKSKQYISKIENQNINIGIEMAIILTNSIRDLTRKKSFGLQTIRLHVEDIFYIDNIENNS